MRRERTLDKRGTIVIGNLHHTVCPDNLKYENIKTKYKIQMLNNTVLILSHIHNRIIELIAEYLYAVIKMHFTVGLWTIFHKQALRAWSVQC